MYVVIAGAGLVGRGLAEQLVQNRHDVVVVDLDKSVCEDVSARTGALAVFGSATSVDVLEEAGILKAEVVVATMRSDADNLAFALLAKSFGVPRIVARMRNQRYESAYKLAGATTTVHLIDLYVNQMVLEIEEPSLQKVATFGAGKASIVVDTIPEGAAIDGKQMMEIGADPEFPAGCVIAGIYRQETQEFIIPRGTAVIRVGDRVFLAADQQSLRRAAKFLHKKK